MAILKPIKLLIGSGAMLSCPLLFTGCYTEYPLEVDATPVLCLNSLITVDEPIEVEVTRTWIYTDMEGSEDHSVTDAIVTVYANGMQMHDDYLPKEGDEIRIHAVSKKYGEADATVTVPRKPLLKDIEYTSVVEWGIGYGWENGMFDIEIHFSPKFRITIEDMPDVENYYIYDMESYGISKEDSEEEKLFLRLTKGSLDYDAEPIFREHISEFDVVQGAVPAGFSFFTDRQFSGKEYRLNLRYTNASADFRGFSEDVDEFCNAAGFEILLSATSESYYKWNYYCWHYDQGSIFDLAGSGLTDPVAAYSNVSTGAGVVAARAVTRVKLPLDDVVVNRLKEGIGKLKDERMEEDR